MAKSMVLKDNHCLKDEFEKKYGRNGYSNEVVKVESIVMTPFSWLEYITHLFSIAEYHPKKIKG